MLIFALSKRIRDMKQTRKLIKNCVLCDSQAEYSYEDYCEYCEDNGIEPKGEDSDSYWDYVSDMRDIDLDCFKDNMEYSKFKGQPCMITGSLGLWHGNPTIVPVLCDDIMEAIEKCLNNNFAFEYDIVLNDGHIDVNIHHHDGTNCFEIHLLSKKGQREAERPIYKWEKDYEPKRFWFKNIYGYLF